jgi:phosphoenolpyruvate synthase/pyruvate phosphate dikinase
MPIASVNKWNVYRFSAETTDGEGTMKAELGGKGAGLAEMTRLGVPVPPGFTIPTSACRHYLKHKRLPDQLEHGIAAAVSWLEGQQKQTFGGVQQPLLVSVRSGATVSMPAMMDTILNVGLTEANLDGLAAANGDLRFALDSYRRLIQMFGSVVMQVPKIRFDQILARVKHKHQAEFDYELQEEALRTIIAEFKACVLEDVGRPFPEDAREQLLMATKAVFQSWTNARAQHYRRMYNIPEEAGTAVTVQAMVFGNSGMDSGTGVGFTRNPITGDAAVFGEFLANAQGEDIVAGIRTPLPLSELAKILPAIYEQLRSITKRLEMHLHNMQDFEFTVQKGKLFLLQTRTAKRSALARIRDLQEANPMMGHRGCRLGITHPEIIIMQVRAILEAAIAVQRKGVRTVPEIMVPLVAGVNEVRAMRKLVDETAEAVFAELRESIPYKFGAMIELPRAAVCAGSIAKEVDFLSFGTNDLTQMTFGFSRDDARKYLDAYIEAGILDKDPFITIDREGVGALMQTAIERARETNPEIKIGVCGEHGGDPESIEFLETLGLNYISCSPARIPAAQLAIAQTTIAGEADSSMSFMEASPEVLGNALGMVM